MSLTLLPPAWTMQEFEQELAYLEMRGLTAGEPRWMERGLHLEGSVSKRVVERVRRRVGLARAIVANGVEQTSVQAQLEATVGGGRRKVTSYASHGLHDYKGKFYPQLVRAAINAAGVPTGGRVLDPFAGCGTTVLEAALLGVQGNGVDANPLAVLVSQAKLSMLGHDPDRLEAELTVLSRPPPVGHDVGDPSYLAEWLPPDNYTYLGRLLAAMKLLPTQELQTIGAVIVSSAIRGASWQDPRQLRVGRRAPEDDPPALQDLVDAALAGAVAALRSARTVDAIDWEKIGVARDRVHFGDARRVGTDLGKPAGYFDAVVTSPPYASALPYIDTDRLSLRAFGMLGTGGQRSAEQRLIGNREISTSLSRSLNAEVDALLEKPGSGSPKLRTVLTAARSGAQEGTAGFRRKRTPGLLFAYFRDMNDVLKECARLLKPNAPAIFVVGDSTITGVGGEVVEVPTTDIMIELATDHGLAVQHDLGKRLTSFGASSTVHQRNAMETERVLFLRKES